MVLGFNYTKRFYTLPHFHKDTSQPMFLSNGELHPGEKQPKGTSDKYPAYTKHLMWNMCSITPLFKHIPETAFFIFSFIFSSCLLKKDLLYKKNITINSITHLPLLLTELTDKATLSPRFCKSIGFFRNFLLSETPIYPDYSELVVGRRGYGLVGRLIWGKSNCGVSAEFNCLWYALSAIVTILLFGRRWTLQL